MFKNHPKGLLAAALANMGERFGFYTMMAILSLFLMAKFGLSETLASTVYSVFYGCIYILSFVGGVIADKTKNYKRTIMIGLVLMTIGYLVMSFPTPTPIPAEQYVAVFAFTCFGLLVIAFGNGLFKGNLQAVVGQMYDNPQYSKFRDAGFSIFYMFINVGAIFAPWIAVAIRNAWLGSHGFGYSGELPELCNNFLNGTISEGGLAKLPELAASVGYMGTNMTDFAKEYLNVFVTGFHYAFIASIFAMLLSLCIYIANKKRFPNPHEKKAVEVAAAQENNMSTEEIRQRIWALIAVFAVVFFFWLSFHQNGLTLTYFAKDFTNLNAIDIRIGGFSFGGAELFQSINPLFVVLLTPVVLAVFAALKARGKEPSTPKKIAIGMGIAACGFILMTLGSMGLPSKAEIVETGGLDQALKVTPFLLIGTYFILTVAELFISPLGISFVSKVAPPHLQGMMQGLWLCATGFANMLLWVGAIFYERWTLSGTWMIFVVACLLSMGIMLGMLKWLERVSK